MGAFNRQGYVPPQEPRWESEVARLARPLLIAVVVGLFLLGGYKVFKSTSISADVAVRDVELTQMGQKLQDVENRLDQLEKKRKVSREVAEPAPPAPAVVAAAKPGPKHHFSFSRATTAQSAPATADVSAAKPPVPNSSSQQRELSLQQANAASGEQWEATADRLGNVVGELDSQRDAIERDQERLDDLARRFARDSQAFTLEKGSGQQQVGPVRLRLQATDPKNQRYTMRMFVDDKTVELRDRALHEAIQFYSPGGKLSFELVISKIGRDSVTGRLVLPQTTSAAAQ